MKKITALLLILSILMTSGLGITAALGAGVTVSPVTEALRPGRSMVLSFESPADGVAQLAVCDEQGNVIMSVAQDTAVTKGGNRLLWNGTSDGKVCPAGEWVLQVTVGDAVGQSPITVGSPVPYLASVSASAAAVSMSEPVIINWHASTAGTLSLGIPGAQERQVLASRQVRAGSGSMVWDGSGLSAGEVTVSLVLTDADGESSTEEYLTMTVAPESDALILEDVQDVMLERMPDPVDQSQFTPSYGSPYAGMDTTMNYWTLPMDITDTEAVWEMLMQPVTVLDSGTKVNPAKVQITIRRQPSTKSEGVGVVTCMTQSVHVLERGKEWSLIECYSSSFKSSKVYAWNMLVQGYVETKYLKTVKPYDRIGLVVDKLTQRMYIFKDGELYDTLLISTGLANEKQPYNETRSGEFLLQCPAVGQFRSDNLFCDMGIRFNGGDLLHEVPHTETKYGKNYTTNERNLGTKASHGCLRVQRLKTSKGTNMGWLWKNRHDEMKVVIWEDWQGRVYAYPDDDTTLYYLPDGGKNYHTAATCSTTKKTLTPFTYGELDTGAFKKLTRCTSCTAPLRKAEIDAINQQYALGGDHDPILSAAQRKCAEELKLKGYYNPD